MTRCQVVGGSAQLSDCFFRADVCSLICIRENKAAVEILEDFCGRQGITPSSRKNGSSRARAVHTEASVDPLPAVDMSIVKAVVQRTIQLCKITTKKSRRFAGGRSITLLCAMPIHDRKLKVKLESLNPLACVLRFAHLPPFC